MLYHILRLKLDLVTYSAKHKNTKQTKYIHGFNKETQIKTQKGKLTFKFDMSNYGYRTMLHHVNLLYSMFFFLFKIRPSPGMI